ncbi:MAG: copper chaperone PCu(A)C [Geminicoccaceae bacterium]
MKHVLRPALLAGLFAIATLTSLPQKSAYAEESETYRLGDLVIEGLWSRETPRSAKNGASFMTITNEGSEDDRLVAASSDAAGRVELHTHLMDGGVMRMRQVEAIDLPAGETVMLQPGGLHVMLLDLPKPLAKGDELALELMFEKSGTIETLVPVADITRGAMGGHAKGKMGEGKGHDMGHGMDGMKGMGEMKPGQ